LYRAGVPLSISTDARTISNITLTEEYGNLQEHFGWTSADLLACNEAALDAAFVDESTKIQLRERLRRGYSFLQTKFAAASEPPERL
jgi:adenosine deaminase